MHYSLYTTEWTKTKCSVFKRITFWPSPLAFFTKRYIFNAYRYLQLLEVVNYMYVIWDNLLFIWKKPFWFWFTLYDRSVMHKNARQEGVEYSPQNVIWLNIFWGIREQTVKCFEIHKKVQFWDNSLGIARVFLKFYELLCHCI